MVGQHGDAALPCQDLTQITTWQVSRKNRGLGRAERAPNPCFCVVNLRTLPGRVAKLCQMMDGGVQLRYSRIVDFTSAHTAAIPGP